MGLILLLFPAVAAPSSQQDRVNPPISRHSDHPSGPWAQGGQRSENQVTAVGVTHMQSKTFHYHCKDIEIRIRFTNKPNIPSNVAN
jgi:hypothetical protein